MGPPGYSCWDLNENGIADPEEDLNLDGVVDVLDCGGDVVASMFWQVGGNDVFEAQALGTVSDAAIDFIVNNERALRLEPSFFSPNLIGGYLGNEVAPDLAGATISGGGKEADDFGLDGPNMVGADFGTVGGGLGNEANGVAATVPGGQNNIAAGANSFAAGYRAKALHTGSFVWADALEDDIESQRDNQFLVRATGGSRFEASATRSVEIWVSGGKLIHTTTGAYLSLGGAWVNSSDVELKDNFEPVDSLEVLQILETVPILTWNYTEEDAEIRHMGPVAQDFYAAFGLGYDAQSLTTVDVDGVALAGVKGLYQLIQEQEARIVAQEQEISALQQQMTALKSQVETLSAQRAAPSRKP
jgi:hypothetical protein